MRKITRWHESGNARARTAAIHRVQTPLPLDFADLWLAFGHAPMDWITDLLQAHHLTGQSRWFAWPCAAYTQAWTPWLNRHKDIHTIEVDFDQLSGDYREWLATKDAELDAFRP